MKKLVISTLAVFAVTLTFAQDHGKEGIRINHKTGEKEHVVHVRPHKELPAAHLADLKKGDMKEGRKADLKKRVRPVMRKHKAGLQHKDKMAPKGNFKTK